MSKDINFNRKMDVVYGEAVAVAPGVRRIVAENPSPLTFKGTNTYLVGSSEVAVIDPGPELPAHRAAIMAAVGKGRISHIFLTHTHRDHSDGIPALQKLTGARTSAARPQNHARGAEGLSSHTGDFVDRGFRPDLPLEHGTAVEGKEWTLSAVHTPGHAPDHICFALEGTGVLFCGDHVMGWNTTVVAPPEGNMHDYLGSLELLLERSDKHYLPGHGETIGEPAKVLRAYLMHRKWREKLILDCVRSGNGRIDQVVDIAYSGIDPAVRKAAALSVLAHLEHLIARGLIATAGKADLHAHYEAV